MGVWAGGNNCPVSPADERQRWAIPRGKLSGEAQGSLKAAANCTVLSSKLAISAYCEPFRKALATMTTCTLVMEWRHQIDFVSTLPIGKLLPRSPLFLLSCF